MKIYLVVEEYRGFKRLLTSYNAFGQPEYTLEAATNMRDEWDRQVAYIGAIYSIKEVEL
jgi:hypothetical protein